MAEIDTTNAQMVSLDKGVNVGVLFPRRSMTPDEALVHAAWLVVMAEIVGAEPGRFDEVLAAVRST